MHGTLELLNLQLALARPSEYYEVFDRWVLARAVSAALKEHARAWVPIDTVVASATPHLSAAYSEQSKAEWARKAVEALTKDEKWEYTTKADALDCKEGNLIRLRSVRLAEEEEARRIAGEAKAAEEKRRIEERRAQFAEEFEATRAQREAKEADSAARAKAKEAEQREAQRQKAVGVARLADLVLPWLMAPPQRKDFMFGKGVLEGHITAFLKLHGGAALTFRVTAELVERERAVWRDGERLAISECYRLRLAELA